LKIVPVSLIVPAFNAADYVVEAIESLLVQDYPNVEIIVVDDGSTDGTGELAAGFGDRVKVHRQSNAGQSAAMATGWSMSKGEFIGYLSADDRLMPQAVRRCAEELASRPDIALVYPDFGIIDEKSVRQATVCPPDFSRRILYADLHCLPGPGALFKRSAYERAGPWRSDLRQIPDLEFFLRLGLEGDFHHLHEVLAEFRMHAGSTTYRIVPFECGEEPLKMVTSFLNRPDLPNDIRCWERSMRANALLLSAAIHGRSGRSARAVRRLGEAAIAEPRTLASLKALSHALLILKGVLKNG